MPWLFTSQGARYTRLAPHGSPNSRTTTYLHESQRRIVGTVLLIILTALMSFYTGRLTASQHYAGVPHCGLRQYLSSMEGTNANCIVETNPKVFHYDRSFGEAPSDHSNAAWDALFPEQGGFFKHPSLAPQRSAFSVFHQLHCLDGIRQGYWLIYSAILEGQKIAEGDIPFMSSPPHIRHCIDLLRQSLMCQPDLTVEVKEADLGGVRGFGTEHQCQVWDQLIAWMSKWETYQQDPPRKGVNVTGDEHRL